MTTRGLPLTGRHADKACMQPKDHYELHDVKSAWATVKQGRVEIRGYLEVVKIAWHIIVCPAIVKQL